MMLLLRLTRSVAAVLTMVAFSAVCANAEYPEKPIKLIVGFGAGGPTDIVARVLADQISARLGQQIVVENKPGASGSIATQMAVSAPSDGYTFLIGTSSIAVNYALFPDFPAKFGEDLVAIAPVGSTDNVLVVRPSLGVKDVEGFVRYVRQSPQGFTYAAFGVGSTSHLAGLAFEQRANTTMQPVMYRGSSEAMKDLLGGHVKAWFAPMPSAIAQIRAGELVPLATTGPARTPWLPDVPTMTEAGFAGFDVRLWVGIFAPAGVEERRLRTFEQAIIEAMAAPDMRENLFRQGLTPFPMTRTQFNAFVSDEIARWKPVVKAVKN